MLSNAWWKNILPTIFLKGNLKLNVIGKECALQKFRLNT